MPTYTLRYELYLLNTCEFEVKANTLDEAIAATEGFDPEAEGYWGCQFDTMTEPRLRSICDKRGVELVRASIPPYLPYSEAQACLTEQWGRNPVLPPFEEEGEVEAKRLQAMWDRVAPEITDEGYADMNRGAERLCRGRKNGRRKR